MEMSQLDGKKKNESSLNFIKGSIANRIIAL